MGEGEAVAAGTGRRGTLEAAAAAQGNLGRVRGYWRTGAGRSLGSNLLLFLRTGGEKTGGIKKSMEGAAYVGGDVRSLGNETKRNDNVLLH